MADVTIESSPLGGYLLRSECVVPRPIEEVFQFFSDAGNLELLTPTWLKFHIVTPRPIEMRQGRLIDYRLRIRGVSLRWQSEITSWDPPWGFVDESRRGPYKFWRHEHRFQPCPDGTRVFDSVHYDVPGGWLTHWLFVGRDLRRIFRYRQDRLAALFPAPSRELSLAAS